MNGPVLHISAGIAVSLLLAFIGLVFAFGRLLLTQFERRMDERSKAQAEIRATERTADQARMGNIENGMVRETARIGELVNRIEKLNVTLPLEYVRREDWIRFSSTIDAKLDKLAEMIHDRLKTGDTSERS